jgi:hypothetical protein
VISSSSGLRLSYAWNGSSLTVKQPNDRSETPCRFTDTGAVASGTLARHINVYTSSPYRTTGRRGADGTPRRLTGTIRVLQTTKLLKGRCTISRPGHVVEKIVGVLATG